MSRGRYRRISTRMWGDEKFRALTPPQPNGQTLWIYLLTGPHTNSIPGLFTAGEAGLAEALGWPVKAFREAFGEVSAKGMAIADWTARVVWVPNAIIHNPPESPNVVRSWPTHLHEIPECALRLDAFRALRTFVETLGQGFAKAFVEAFPKGFAGPLAKGMANQEQEQEQEHTTLSPSGDPPSPPPFTSSNGHHPLTVQELVDLYNQIAPAELARVTRLSEGRKRKAKAYLAAFPDREFWTSAFAELQASPLLRGLRPSPGHEHFRGDFDWLLTKGKDGTENVVKVAEGRYREEVSAPAHETPEETRRRQRYLLTGEES